MSEKTEKGATTWGDALRNARQLGEFKTTSGADSRQGARATILGIDPGLDGAVAVLTEAGELLQIEDMPTLEDGAKGRRALNAPLLAAIVYRSHATRAFCELVGPRPTDGSAAGFGFGRNRGIIEGVLAAAGVPLLMIAPPVWKRASGIAPGRENKDSARSIAIAQWPAHAAFFARKKDCDRAEAALIGLSGLKREARR